MNPKIVIRQTIGGIIIFICLGLITLFFSHGWYDWQEANRIEQQITVPAK